MWRFAEVHPIFKKGHRDYAANYRPISLCRLACKIMESIKRSTMCDYLIDNDLFCHAQHGFVISDLLYHLC